MLHGIYLIRDQNPCICLIPQGLYISRLSLLMSNQWGHVVTHARTSCCILICYSRCMERCEQSGDGLRRGTFTYMYRIRTGSRPAPPYLGFVFDETVFVCVTRDTCYISHMHNKETCKVDRHPIYILY